MELKMQLQFELTEFAAGHETDRVPASGNYDYWLLLMEYFLAKSDLFEIHCFDEETETIEELTSGLPGLFDINVKQGMTIFSGDLTLDIAEFLVSRHISRKKKLKWFSVFLSRGEQHVFSSEHWGTEFFVPDITEDDLLFIRHVAPVDAHFNQYT